MKQKHLLYQQKKKLQKIYVVQKYQNHLIQVQLVQEEYIHNQLEEVQVVENLNQVKKYKNYVKHLKEENL